MRAFFDTNVLVYLFDNEVPAKKAVAQELLRAETEKGRVLLSTQVLQEFYVTVTRKLAVPLSPEDAEDVVKTLTKLTVAEVDSETVLSGIRTSRRYGFSFWDGLIVATALRSGATILYTEDLQHDQDIEGLRVVNPFI